MNITVYLGANEGNDPSLRKAVRELGSWIGESGNRLVYGGSKSGLMGEIAESVLQAGGEVIGVEPQFFIDMEYQYDEITELIVTKDMTERKTKMIELGDVFIAFPGGTGTLEEIAEVMSKVSLKHLEAPCILYNLNGYYDSLKALLSHMTEKGLSSPERQEGIYFARDLSEIRKIIENQRSNATTTPPENTQGIGNQLGKQVKTHNCNAQHHQDHTGDTVQGLRGRLVGEQCSDPRPDQGKYNAQDPYRPVRHTADGKMGGSTGKCGKCHDEDAGSYSGLQFITQDRGQDQQHHHTATGTDEATDEADQHTAYQRLDGSFLRGDTLHGFLGGHYGTDDEFDT